MSTASPPENAQKKTRVLIADDHPAFGQGLKRLLEGESDFDVVAVVDNGEDAVRAARELSPDVVILDVAMPKLDGIGATRQIKAFRPDIGVIVLTAYEQDSYVLGAIEAGASAYLLKTRSISEIIGAVRAVKTGETVLSPSVAQKLFRHLASAQGKTSVSGAFQQLH